MIESSPVSQPGMREDAIGSMVHEDATGPMPRDDKKSWASHLPSAEGVAKGVATGAAVSTITKTGRKVMSALIKNPIVMFGVGFAAGYFAHKYRKEIIAAASTAAEQSKDFVLRQKESLEDLLAESKDEADDAGTQV